LTNVMVTVISRELLLQMIKENPEQMGKLLSYFAKRLRDMDDQAMVQMFAPQAARIKFELLKLWQSAMPERNNPEIRTAKVGPKQIARSAHVFVEDVMDSLEQEKIAGNLEYFTKKIRFLKNPVNDKRQL